MTADSDIAMLGSMTAEMGSTLAKLSEATTKLAQFRQHRIELVELVAKLRGENAELRKACEAEHECFLQGNLEHNATQARLMGLRDENTALRKGRDRVLADAFALQDENAKLKRTVDSLSEGKK